MNESFKIREFVLEWASYLEQRGHRLRRTRGGFRMLLSRNERARYRWLFLHVQGSTRRLTPIEREQVVREHRLGQEAGERVYLVIKFTRPVVKVIALPADKAAGTLRLSADRGGIPWDW